MLRAEYYNTVVYDDAGNEHKVFTVTIYDVDDHMELNFCYWESGNPDDGSKLENRLVTYEGDCPLSKNWVGV